MFFGHAAYTLDEKNRLMYPARYRTCLEQGFVMTPGTDKFILVYPMAEFAKLEAKIDQLPMFDPLAERLRRRLYSNATNDTLDKSGRVVLPEDLRKYAQVEKGVIVAGVGRFIEIWNPEAWAKTKLEEDDIMKQREALVKLGI